MDSTATCGRSSNVKYMINTSGGTKPNTMNFWVCASGVFINISDTGDRGAAGMGLHTWDMGVAP